MKNSNCTKIVTSFTAVFLFVACNVLLSKDSISIYKDVGQQYVASLLSSIAQSAQPIGTAQNSTPQALTKQEKVSIYLDALARCAEQPVINQVTFNVLHDLNIVRGHIQDAQKSVYNVLNKTTTTFGEVALMRMLAQPEADIACLRARQVFIKELVNNDELRAQIKDLLSRVHEAESAFFGYWKSENPEVEKQIKEVFWNNSRFVPASFNRNALALEVGTRLDNLKTSLKITAPFLFAGLINCLAQYASKQEISIADVGTAIFDFCKNLIDPRPLYRELADVQAGKFHEDIYVDMCKKAEDAHVQVPLSKKAFNRIGYVAVGVEGLLQIGIIAAYSYSVKVAMDNALRHNNTITHLHDRMIDVATVITTLSDIFALADQCPAMSRGMSYLADAQKCITDKQCSKECATLIDLLHKNTFKEKSSFFSLSGRVLAAHTLMKQTKNELMVPLQALGELDACLAIAQLYKESQNRHASYCFVEYVTKDAPYVDMQDFWNPLIHPGQVVTNSITFDGGINPHGVILTGSNTAGKSTLLKGIMINLLLAQTCGIAAAQKMVITPFTQLATSLNISDNTAAGESLFQAEVNRARSIIDTIDSLSAKQFIFLGIDELFTGTAVEKGEKAAGDVVMYLAQKPHCLFIFATHFPHVTTIADLTKGICQNKKMEAYIEGETIVRPFKLEDGVSTQNIADAILHKELPNLAVH